MDFDAAALDARYRTSFGRLAGYLPPEPAALHRWIKALDVDIADRLANGGRHRSRAVAVLRSLIENDSIVRMYLQETIDQVSEAHKIVEDIEQFLVVLDKITVTAPAYNPDNDWRNFFPMSSLFAYMMMTPAGEAIFRNGPFNAALRGILQEWCRFLDSSESQYVLNIGPSGWLSHSAYAYGRLEDFIIPDRSAAFWGWPSFNAYFHRQIQPARRPVDDPDAPNVIVSANDGTVYRIERGVRCSDRFWAKGQPYSLADMMHGRHVDRFVGGDVFQSFLGGNDYHRLHAPIDGIVREAFVVDGLMFSEAESAGPDPTGGTYSLSYAASVNTRGLLFVESPHPAIGMVCVIAIGIAEISSVTVTVKVGDAIRKGSEIGYFSYGGSSLALVFQPGSIACFTVPSPPPPTGNPQDGTKIKTNARIAIGAIGALGRSA
jgi:phosphatidylserine decarboxylase